MSRWSQHELDEIDGTQELTLASARRDGTGGVEEDVSLVESGDAGERIDAAYQTKYGRRYPTIVPSILAPQARAATLKLVGRERPLTAERYTWTSEHSEAPSRYRRSGSAAWA